MSALRRSRDTAPSLATGRLGASESSWPRAGTRLAGLAGRITVGQVVAATLVIALALRLWGLTYGLPYDYHYDEHFYINTALQTGAGNINYEPFMPRGLSNLEAIGFGIYYLFGRASHLFSSAAAFERAYRSDPTVFYVLARVLVALMGTGTCLAVFWLGRRTSGRIVGVMAAALLAVSFGHVRESHFAVPDVPPALLITLATALTVAGVADAKKRYIYAAGLLTGVATAFKWNALLALIVPLLGAIRMDAQGSRASGQRLRCRSTLLTLLGCAAGFGLSSPQVLLNPSPYLRMALSQAAAGDTGGYEIWQIDTLPGWLFYVKTLYLQLGAIPFLLASIGGVRRLVRFIGTREWTSGLLLAFPLIYFGLMGATRHYFVRYTVPLMPFAMLFAAEAIAAAGSWATSRRRPATRMLVPVMLAAAMIQPLASSIRLDQLWTQTDTRTLAKDWIEANLTKGTKIAADWRIHTPPLSTPDRVRAGASRIYDLTYVEGTGLSDRSIEDYRLQGFDYLIASSFIDDLTLVDPEHNIARRESYAQLQRELPLLQEFRPYSGNTAPGFVFDEIYGPFVSLWQRERPGPTIKVYRLTPAGLSPQ